MKEPVIEICELRHTLSGEGSTSGLPVLLVRTSGCNLDCRWCDARYARRPGTRVPVAAILEKARTLRCKTILLTGGEPLLQDEVAAFCSSCIRAGLRVVVETNGSLDIGPVAGRCSVVMDIKLPGSGEFEKMRLENIGLLGKGDELKFVVSTRADFETALDVLDVHPPAPGVGVIASPVHGVCNPADIAAWILDARRELRLGIQLHKYVWPAGEDGCAVDLRA
ncbi:MAG: radical SAM protein [Deltaproteobacteria bacterium]|nr:MAG: radical SAM protein [Deltaproteobacteria bacterium]